MDFMSKYVDVVVVEKVGINIRRGPVEKMSTADAEYLAHGIASMKNAILVWPNSPHGVVWHNFDNDSIIGNALEQIGKTLIRMQSLIHLSPLVEQTLLPNAP